jgi:hypothetical protein
VGALGPRLLTGRGAGAGGILELDGAEPRFSTIFRTEMGLGSIARNGTEELLVSGYGGRIVLLSRPPGYGVGAPP